MHVQRAVIATESVDLAAYRPAATQAPQAPRTSVGTLTNAAVEGVEDRKVRTQQSNAPASVAVTLTAADRAAIASATGFYISATGEVTPDGIAPWSFITQYVEQRRAQRAPASGPEVAPISGTGLDSSGRFFDVSA
jgi:hypothetical protein